MRALLLTAVLCVGGVASTNCEASEADPGQEDPADFELSLAEAQALAELRPLAGARRLEALRAEYPQDFRVALAAGWAWLGAGAWARAEAAFEQASALSGGSPLATQGLEALWAARAPRLTLSPSAAASALPGYPGWDRGMSAGLAADAVLGGRALVGGLGRAGSLQGDEGSVPWAELHLGAGASWPALGLMAHAGLLSLGEASLSDAAQGTLARAAADGAGQGGGYGGGQGSGEGNGYGPGGPEDEVEVTLEAAQFGGLSARVSPWGDLYLEGSAALWEAGVAWRGVAAWTSPALGGLRLEPGGALQSGVYGPGGSGFVTLRWRGASAGAELGGRVGDEERPVSLGLRTVHPLEGRINAGAWASVSAAVSPRLELRLGGEWLRAADEQQTMELLVAALSASWSAGGAP